MKRPTPASFKADTKTAAPRSLKDPVGNRKSNFASTRRPASSISVIGCHGFADRNSTPNGQHRPVSPHRKLTLVQLERGRLENEVKQTATVAPGDLATERKLQQALAASQFGHE